MKTLEDYKRSIDDLKAKRKLLQQQEAKETDLLGEAKEDLKLNEDFASGWFWGCFCCGCVASIVLDLELVG